MAEEKKELADLIDGGTLVVAGSRLDPNRMPPILAGQSTKAMERRVERFYFSIASILEAWVKRRPSPRTQRAYRQDIEALIAFMTLDWPEQSTEFLAVSVDDKRTWRDSLQAAGMAPKTVNRRISSVSSFYKYLQAVAAELQLPIVVPNRPTPNSSDVLLKTQSMRPRHLRRHELANSWAFRKATMSSRFATEPSCGFAFTPAFALALFAESEPRIFTSRAMRPRFALPKKATSEGPSASIANVP